MSYQKRVFFRESYDCQSGDKDSGSFQGKLIKANYVSQEYSFAFKVEDSLMRMQISYKNDCVEIVEEFSSAKSKMKLELNKQHDYAIELSNGYSLNFLLEATEIVFDKDVIKLKYKLIDKVKKDTISLHEIRICGED